MSRLTQFLKRALLNWQAGEWNPRNYCPACGPYSNCEKFRRISAHLGGF